MILLLLATACAERGGASPNGRDPRVVSLHDVTTEIVVGLGAADHLVGIADPVDVTAEVQQAVERVPRVESLETILPLRPDVVFGLGVVSERDPELVNRLRERGIEVYLADPATIADVYSLTRAVAKRTGDLAAGERVVEGLRARVQRGYSSAPSRRPRIFVYDCCDPPFTAGGRTVLTDLIERAGGRNVFAELDDDWTHVSWEEVVARQPELVVIHSYGDDAQGGLLEKSRKLNTVRSLSTLPTVVMPLGWSLGGLRSADGLERLRQAMAEHRP